MIDLQTLIIKMVKKAASHLNLVFLVEKKNNLFIHTSVAKELQDLLGLEPSKIINKSLKQLYTERVAQERRDSYERAWKGEEVYYKFDTTNSKYSFCGVLSPVLLNGKVVSLMGYIVPLNVLPKELINIA